MPRLRWPEALPPAQALTAAAFTARTEARQRGSCKRPRLRRERRKKTPLVRIRTSRAAVARAVPPLMSGMKGSIYSRRPCGQVPQHKVAIVAMRIIRLGNRSRAAP
jgi:hypothetical protein